MRENDGSPQEEPSLFDAEEEPTLFATPQPSEPSRPSRWTPYESLGWEELEERARSCTKCPLHTTRRHVVFGTGNRNADLMFVGEAPGHEEDLQGLPFVGRAGQLLNRMIAAMGLRREDVYIANIIKCRPPENRNPLPDEIRECFPYLLRQIQLVRPKVIVALGTVAAQTLLETRQRVTRLRGRFYPIEGGIQVMPTFHPAFLLRNPSAKREAWEDLQLVMRELGLRPSTPDSP